MFISRKNRGWKIFAVCDDKDVEDESLSPYLTISLIREKPQREGVIVKMPDPGSQEEKYGEPIKIIHHSKKLSK